MIEKTIDPLWDQTQAAIFLGLKPNTLATWRLRRCGPPYLKMGARLVRYDRAELLAWAKKREG